MGQTGSFIVFLAPEALVMILIAVSKMVAMPFVCSLAGWRLGSLKCAWAASTHCTLGFVLGAFE